MVPIRTPPRFGTTLRSRRSVARRLRRATLLLLGALAAPLAAHDFWIEPSTFHPAPGEPVELRLRVGERFHGDPVAFDPRRVESFRGVGAGGTLEVAGEAGDEPAGRFHPPAPGDWWIVYDSEPAPIELEGAAFERYLAEEGLETVLAERRARGESARPGREIYSRCAKSVVRAGSGGPAAPRRVGLELELVLEEAPSGPGDLRVQLIFRGEPLAGARVVALTATRPDAPLVAHTDDDGRAVLPLAAGGVWLVKSVHMVPAPADRRDEADWESLWASLTLEIP